MMICISMTFLEDWVLGRVQIMHAELINRINTEKYYLNFEGLGDTETRATFYLLLRFLLGTSIPGDEES